MEQAIQQKLEDEKKRLNDLETKEYDALSVYDKTIASDSPEGALITAKRLVSNHIKYYERELEKEEAEKSEEPIEIVVKNTGYGHSGVMKILTSQIKAIRNVTVNGDKLGNFIETEHDRHFIDQETAQLLADLTGKEIKVNVFQTKQLDDEAIHQQHSEWCKKCEEAKQNYGFMFFDAEILVDIYTQETKANPDVTEENHTIGGLGSWYGSGGYGDENGEELKKNILRYKKRQLETPYKEGSDGYFLRRVKADNIRLFVTKAGEEYLNMKGINAEELKKEFDEMPENNATKDDLLKQELMEYTKEELRKTEEEFRIIDESMRAKIGISKENSYDREPKCAEEYKDLSNDEIVKLRIKVKTKLDTLQSVEDDFYKEIRGEKEFDMSEDNIKMIMELVGV